MRIYARLLGYARPHWPMFLLGVLGMVLFAAVDTGLAWLVKQFLDGAFVERDSRVLVLVPAGIIALFAARGIGDYLSIFAPGWVGRQVIKAIRHDLFARYLELPSAFFDRNGVAHLLSRLTYNIELVAEAATTAITSMIRDTLTIAGLLGWLLWLNWRLTVFALLVSPLIIGLIRITSRLFRRYSARIQSSMGDVTRVAKESLESQRMIKVFNAERQQLEAFERVNELNRASYMKLVTVKAVSNPVVQMLAALGLAAVMYVAIRDVMAQGLTVGEFTSFLTALLLITAPLRRLVSLVGPLQQGVAAGESVFEILDTAAEDQGGTLAIGRAQGAIEFRGVSFAYDVDKGEVLRDIDFAIAPGETVAIVGRSGSGKSTLIGLLPRFHDPEAGSVLLDGVDLRQYRLADLRRQISLVSQDVMLIDDSIRANIAFSAPEAQQQAVEAAAAAAELIRGSYRANIGVRIKADGSPVTEADVAAEQAIRKIVQGRFPDDGFFGEETAAERMDAEHLWIVDPIDGTKSFVRQYPMFSTQIALLRRGRLELGVSSAPVYGETIWAERGNGAWMGEQRLAVSRIAAFGQATISTGNLRTLAAGPRWAALGRMVMQLDRIRGFGDFLHYHLLAAGKIEAVIESDIGILDIAALTVIVEEAGGRVTDLDGAPIGLQSNSVLASNGAMHDAILAELAR